jgi:holliday junction DNA helicase RuvA
MYLVSKYSRVAAVQTCLYNRGMIAKLTGTITDKLAESVIVDINGVGYEVFLTAEDHGRAAIGRKSSYHIFEQVREDQFTLYGFEDIATKAFYIQLLSVNGIGPKVAMGILSAARLDRLQQAIAAGDAELLKGVAGVGKKTAERVVVELKNKVSAHGSIANVTAGDSVYLALLGLGYSSLQAAEAVAAVPENIEGEEARLKAALKGMNK